MTPLVSKSVMSHDHVTHVMWLVYFVCLRFNVYLDTPTNFLLTPAAQDGHMSNEARCL